MKKLIEKPFKFLEGGVSPNPLVFGTDENPIELEGIDVTAKKLNWLEKRWNDIKWAFRNVSNDINKQADLYVANHRRAEERNPNFSQEHDAWNNFNETMNAVTGGVWKNSSPSQLVGTVTHIVRGEPILGSWMNFNNGVVGAINEDWANEHPYLTMAGNMIFDGVALNAKPLYSFGRTNLGTKSSRLSYVLDRNLNSLEVPQSLNFGKGVERYKWGDAEFGNPNLFYHLDGGDYKGWNYPKVKGSYLKDGYLYPGDAPNAELLAYSWWNKGDGYWGKDSWNRLIISGNKPEFLHVRSLPYKIGLWDPASKKSFVTNKEYVSSKPIKVSPENIFYFDELRNGWYRTPLRESIILLGESYSNN